MEYIEQKWTFESSLGVRRQLDFIISGPGLLEAAPQPVDHLSLGSDHRAVSAIFHILRQNWQSGRQRQKQDGTWSAPTDFKQDLEKEIHSKQPASVREVEEVLVQVAEGCHACSLPVVQPAPQFAGVLSNLRAKRRSCRNASELTDVSKQIQKEVRKDLRKLKSEKVRRKLEAFKNLSELHSVHRLPVVKARTQTKPPETMGEFMAETFRSSNGSPNYSNTMIAQLPLVTLPELNQALRRMSRGRCSDRSGGALEMIVCGGHLIQQCLVNSYNLFLQTGNMEADWWHTFFTLLPKGGDVNDPGNWRPIAVLNVTYKLCSRIVHDRIGQFWTKSNRMIKWDSGADAARRMHFSYSKMPSASRSRAALRSGSLAWISRRRLIA